MSLNPTFIKPQDVDLMGLSELSLLNRRPQESRTLKTEILELVAFFGWLKPVR